MKNMWVTRILIGALIILFGVLMLLDNLGYLGFWDFFQEYWPAIFIVIGMGYLVRKLWLSAFFFISVGALLLALNLDLIPGSLWTYIVPVGVMIIGLALLLPATARRSRENSDNYYQDQREVLNLAAILGGSVKKVTTTHFRHGDILAVFGGATIDLLGAELAPTGAVLEITSIFGGVDIIAPQDWQIDVQVSSIFGGVDDRRTTIAKELQTDKVLLIRGVCLFGGIDIKN
ncbi:MAG: LiaF transmembrane domain-containing protein [Culicoidibacterales bacterium]